MNAPSPTTLVGSLVTFTIKVDGKAIDSSFDVASIVTMTAVNRVPRARLTISDGSPAEQTFPISDGKTFVPGNELEILAGYNSKETLLFKGVIAKQSVEVEGGAAPRLIVDVVDPVLSMTLERTNSVFEDRTDTQIIEELIGRHRGLSKSVAATKGKQGRVVQYYASDWDMMLTRAEANAMVVTVANGKVTVGPPDTDQSAALTISYGDSILELHAELDATNQFDAKAIKSYAWDDATQELLEAGPGSVKVVEAGNLSSATLAKVFDVKRYLQQSAGALDKDSLTAWSSGELLKSKLAKLRGVVKFKGTDKVALGKVIELEGVGGRFNGKLWVSGVEHRLAGGSWIATVQFGLSPDWFSAEAKNVTAPDAAGLLPAVKGLQSGIVQQIDKDPDGEFRVLITLPILQAGKKGIWARLGTFYGSNKVGEFFYPEVGDEVVVAFMNEDPRYPVIVGSVYSKKRPPPYTPDNKNSKKAIVTRSKLEISFDETDKIIEISTPGKHRIRLDDKSGALSIRDGNDNQISLSKGGITISSASNLKLKAKGNVSVEAGANLTNKAKANLTLDGLQVSAKAKTKFAAQGSAAAELKSTGILTIRGSLVKIN